MNNKKNEMADNSDKEIEEKIFLPRREKNKKG